MSYIRNVVPVNWRMILPTMLARLEWHMSWREQAVPRNFTRHFAGQITVQRCLSTTHTLNCLGNLGSSVTGQCLVYTISSDYLSKLGH